jgi:hypothetical protein
VNEKKWGRSCSSLIKDSNGENMKKNMQNEFRAAEIAFHQGTIFQRPTTGNHFNIRGIPFFLMITVSS